MAKPAAIKPVSPDLAKIFHLLYGHPDAGKTTYITEGAKAGMKILIIKSPLDHFPVRSMNSGAEQWECHDHNEFTEALEYTRHDGHLYDWVWLDSISLTQDQLLQSIWDEVIAEKPHRAKFGPDKPEYGVNMWRIAQWVRHMVGSNITNIGITAHPDEMPNPFNEDGGMIMMPWIQGKNMPKKIVGMMNFVAYLEVRENEKDRWRRLHTRSSEYLYAKDQFEAFPTGRLDHPTLPKVVAAIDAARSGKVTQLPRGGRGRSAQASGRGRGRRQTA